MSVKKLTIIIPCYNEENLITTVLEKVLQTKLDHGLEKQIIIVNDGSTDNSANAIDKFCAKNPSAISIHQQTNSGKGAAVKTALQQVNGDIIIIQDADGHADVVYGSRFMGSGPHRVLFFFHTIGNKFLTFLSNIFTGLNLTDMETGYKMFRTDVLKQIRLKENRFGFEPEVTAKTSRIKNIRFYEVGIAYYGRTYDDGKKIKWTDGLHAIWCILKYNILSRK
jgi:glycosyltransferase involved in cell wall biosynthesis